MKSRIDAFADDIIDLWLKKYSDLEREGVVDALLEILINKDAKYYQLEDKEREAWLTFSACEIISELPQNCEIFVDDETVKKSVRVKFGYDTMCEECKAEFDRQLNLDVGELGVDREDIPL